MNVLQVMLLIFGILIFLTILILGLWFKERFLTIWFGKLYGLMIFVSEDMPVIHKIRTKNDYIDYDDKTYPIYNHKPVNNIRWQIYDSRFPEPRKIYLGDKKEKSKFTFSNFDLKKFVNSKFLEKLNKDKISMETIMVLGACGLCIIGIIVLYMKIIDLSQTVDAIGSAVKIVKSVK